MSPGVLLATAMIVAIGLCWSAGIWLVTSAQSPVPRWWRRRRLERTVRVETGDLDRKIIELTLRVQEDDAA